jgi:hypothetical protein
MIAAFVSVVALALMSRRDIQLGLLEWISLAALLGLAAWMLASSTWGISGSEATREVERTLVYFAGLTALVSVVETRSVRALVTGLSARQPCSRCTDSAIGRSADRRRIPSRGRC